MTETTEQAVVETPAPDASATEQTDQVEQEQAESSTAADDADDSSAPRPKGVQKRIDELTRNWRETERDRDYWRDMATRQQPQAQPEPAKAEAPKPRPKLEDFNYDEVAYQTALDAYYETKADEIVDRKLSEREQARQKVERTKSWKSREADFEKSTPDYKQVAHYAPISDAMAPLIMESELGPQIAYHLGKPENRAEAERIAQLDPVQQAREIGRLEAKFEKPAASAPAPKPVSKAPPPPPRIEGIESPAPVRADSADSDRLSDSEWVRLRNKQLARKKG